jgi:hypothetical protein
VKTADSAVQWWRDQLERRHLHKRFYKQREEFGIAEFHAMDVGNTFKTGRVRVEDALAAVAVFDEIVCTPGHLFRANALREQAEYLRHAADDAYAEGWPQKKVEGFRDQAGSKYQEAFQEAGAKSELLRAKGLEAIDRNFDSSYHMLSSTAWSLVLWNLHRGQADVARKWQATVREVSRDPRSEMETGDLWALEYHFLGEAASGPGLPQSLDSSAAKGPLWAPPSVQGVSLDTLVYAEVNCDDAEIQLKVWRWPILDSENRLQWPEEEKDWHWVDIVPESFWAATGQIQPRPTGNSILALRLKGEFPAFHSGPDPTYEFDDLFSACVAEVTREVHAKSLETVLSVDRDQLST